jgi:hypothetical protein
MKAESDQPERLGPAGRGPRYWYRITGLPGWKRAELGMPAFSLAQCLPHGQADRARKFFAFLRRILRGRILVRGVSRDSDSATTRQPS